MTKCVASFVSLFFLAALLWGTPASLAQVESVRTDAKFSPVGLPNQVHLGPNVSGRIMIGPLKPTPLSERLVFGAYFLLLLGGTVAWAIAGSRLYTKRYYTTQTKRI